MLRPVEDLVLRLPNAPVDSDHGHSGLSSVRRVDAASEASRSGNSGAGQFVHLMQGADLDASWPGVGTRRQHRPA